MGEIADLMINGDICEGCGCELGDGDGFPRRCTGCFGNTSERNPFNRAARTEQTRMVRPNQEWIDEHGQYRVMAVSQKYAMCRRKNAVPFVRHVNEINSKSRLKGAKS